MSEKFIEAIKNLLPNGKAWLVPTDGDHDKFITALSKEFARSETFIKGILSESTPNTADELLDEWVNIYNINPELSDAIKKNLAITYYTSTGNQSASYIEDQLLKTGFDVDLVEKNYGQSACGVAVCGTATCSGVGVLVFVVATLTLDEESELKKLVDYYKPLHIGVIYFIKRSTGKSGGFLPFILNLDTLGRT